jgi:hypothetical protein
VSLLCGVVLTSSARAEVLIRWDRDQVPAADDLGISTLVIPAKNKAAVQRALEQGYAVVVEVDAPAIAAFAPPSGRVTGVIVKGTATRAQLSQFRLRLKPRGITVRTLEERGKWPHIRTNWVTNENGVLQVSSRTQQPWIENNAALIKVAQTTQADANAVPLLTYPWTPITLSDIQEGPALENYLVAIAESGSFGADLVLPLHERFENDLLLGLPRARAWWTEMRRAIAFYASNLPNRYQAAATIGVVTADPMRWFEVMNLLSRHTLPFELIPQDKFVAGAAGRDPSAAGRDLSKLDLLVMLDAPDARQAGILTKFAENGGTVVLPGIQGKFPWQTAAPASSAPSAKTDTQTQTTYTVGKGRIVEHRDPPANPDAFAQQVRQLLGRDGRVLQTWNGVTVIAARYEAPADPGHTVLLTALNYSHQELPLQVRVPGKFSAVHYESPETAMTLLPFQQRDGFTEFVIPALRIGARIFLTPDAAAPGGSR